LPAVDNLLNLRCKEVACSWQFKSFWWGWCSCWPQTVLGSSSMCGKFFWFLSDALVGLCQSVWFLTPVCFVHHKANVLCVAIETLVQGIMMQIKWGKYLSDLFNITNWIRQRGVL